MSKANQHSFNSASGKAARGTGAIERGATVLRDEDTRELRGQQLIQARIAGVPLHEAAPLVGLSARQAQKELKWMQRTGRIQKYEAKVVTLVPKAIEVLRGALEEGDVKVAMKLLDSLLRLGDRAEARSSKDGDRQASLEDHLTKLQMRAAYEASRLGGDAADPTSDSETVVAITVPATSLPEPYAPECDRHPDDEPTEALDDGSQSPRLGDHGA